MSATLTRLSVALLLILAVIITFELTSLDLWIEDLCYDSQSQSWRIHSSMSVLNWLFYRGPKLALMAFGSFLLLRGILPSKRWERFPLSRRSSWYCLICLVLIPLVVAISKETTGKYCPRQIERYGGTRPYFRLLESQVTEADLGSPGRCFPAGHPSGGFALICLYFIGRDRKWKWRGLAIGLSLGGLMGAYQMLKGAHYLSHVLVTLALAWFICSALASLFRLPRPESSSSSTTSIP